MKELPYLPTGKEILYVEPDHEFMLLAKNVAKQGSLDLLHPTGAVLVKNGKPIGAGANGSVFHTHLGCVRKLLRVPTGKSYFLCGGCSPKNHAEQKAIKEAQSKKLSPKGADIYLWGHWWCCESCWQTMITAGIKNVYLPKGAWEEFGQSRTKKK
jgi:deoxycytidylate deaminase